MLDNLILEPTTSLRPHLRDLDFSPSRMSDRDCFPKAFIHDWRSSSLPKQSRSCSDGPIHCWGTEDRTERDPSGSRGVEPNPSTIWNEKLKDDNVVRMYPRITESNAAREGSTSSNFRRSPAFTPAFSHPNTTSWTAPSMTSSFDFAASADPRTVDCFPGSLGARNAKESYSGKGPDARVDLKLEADDDAESIGTDDEGVDRAQTAAERLAARRKMKRFRLTHQQTRFLMSEFAKQPHPDATHRERLSREIPGLTPRQVQVWFQNRRAKIKRLTADDRDRMIRMRAVPDDFDNVQALHSPYGAIRGSTGETSSLPRVQGDGTTGRGMLRPLMIDVGRHDELYSSPTGLTPSMEGASLGPMAAMGSSHLSSPVHQAPSSLGPAASFDTISQLQSSKSRPGQVAGSTSLSNPNYTTDHLHSAPLSAFPWPGNTADDRTSTLNNRHLALQRPFHPRAIAGKSLLNNGPSSTGSEGDPQTAGLGQAGMLRSSLYPSRARAFTTPLALNIAPDVREASHAQVYETITTSAPSTSRHPGPTAYPREWNTTPYQPAPLSAPLSLPTPTSLRSRADVTDGSNSPYCTPLTTPDENFQMFQANVPNQPQNVSGERFY